MEGLEGMSRGKKILLFVGGGIALILATILYMFLARLEPRDFIRLPDGVLDDAIYAAQQNDLKEFKRLFTKEMQEKIQIMHDSNMNRDMGTTSDRENADLFWTWDTIMTRMAKQGGFEVAPSSTKFFDYIVDGKAKVEIIYVDKDQNKERQKNYTLYRNGGVWRIDLKSDPDFVKAYKQSVKSIDTISYEDRTDD